MLPFVALAQGSRPSSPFEVDTLPPYKIQPELEVLLVGTGISILANFADYQLQADAHGWKGLMWEQGYRAPKWGVFDFIPHDGYHITQWFRNILMLGLPVAIFLMADEWKWWHKCLAILGCYIVGRGVGFSFPYQRLN